MVEGVVVGVGRSIWWLEFWGWGVLVLDSVLEGSFHIGFSFTRTLIVEIISEAFGLTSWALLLLKSLITAGISLLSLKIFLGHSAAASSSYSW